MNIQEYTQQEKLKAKQRSDKDAFREVDEEKKKKKAAYMKEYYKRNPEKAIENRLKTRERYKTNPEALERKREYDREYAMKNSIPAVERASAHYEKNKESIKRYSLQRAFKLKVKAVNVLGGKCSRCGFDEHPAALQFHHKDPSTKTFNITTKQLTNPKRFTWAIIEEEILKCELLCANCHFVIESKWDIEEWNESK